MNRGRHPERLPFDEREREAVIVRHDDAAAAGSPTYDDPRTGLAVFTSAFHLARGSCCDSGCRHCPFDAGGGR